jgi:hypothetical protein
MLNGASSPKRVQELRHYYHLREPLNERKEDMGTTKLAGRLLRKRR